MQFPSPDSRVLPDKIQCKSPPLNTQPSTEQTKIVGSLVGLAIGDALGASVEFRPYQYLVDNPVKYMQSGGTWGLQAGQWTDDTSMALCLASSLITQHGFNSYDQMVRYKWWFKKGFLSSTGECFDIGSTTRAALEEFCRRQDILKQHFRIAKDEDIDKLSFEQIKNVKNFSEYCGVTEKAGNGPLMRLAPVPLFYFRQPKLAVKFAGDNARLTHGDQRAVDACRYYAALIVAAVQGEPKTELLNEKFYEKHQQWFEPEKLHDEVLRVARGSYKKSRGYEDGIRGKSYIVNTLEAALWAFWSDENLFEKGVLRAVNLGDDTDTTAAVYGQLAGACYGVSAIPSHWAAQLYARDLLICVGEWLYFEGGQIRNDTAQQQQQQQKMTPQQQQKMTPQQQQKMTPQQQQQKMTPQQQQQQKMTPQQQQQKMTPQQQQQQKMTPQHQNQSRISTSQSNQYRDSHASTQQMSPTVHKEYIGYDAPKPQKPLQHAAVQTSPQIQFANTTNVGTRYGEKSKPDPSKLPAAGVPSGFNHR